MNMLAGGVATILSLMVLSRVVADNPLFRIAQGLLVGIGLGYAGAIVLSATWLPTLEAAAGGTLSLERGLALLLAIVLGLAVATRWLGSRWSNIANVPLAIVFGTAAAIALAGAASGTIAPQLLDTLALERLGAATPDAIAGTITLIGTLMITLFSFRYGAPRSRADRAVRATGRMLLLAAFGVMLAAVVTTFLTALVAQAQTIADWVSQFSW